MGPDVEQGDGVRPDTEQKKGGVTRGQMQSRGVVCSQTQSSSSVGQWVVAVAATCKLLSLIIGGSGSAGWGMECSVLTHPLSFLTGNSLVNTYWIY